jgi:phage antirepressor YoqD-like protein
MTYIDLDLIKVKDTHNMKNSSTIIQLLLEI